MKDLSKVFIDLSKLSEEQIKSLSQVFENAGDKVLPETISDLISGKITDGFKFLFYSPSGWNQNDYPLNGRTELTYPEFIKLFEGGESDGWIKIENETDLPKEDILYWVVKNGEVVDMENWELTLNFHNKRGVTHYQPIQKPEPPKF